MTPDQGVLSARLMTLAQLCSGSLVLGKEDRWLEFGIRWADGELADDVLQLETDGYAEVDDVVQFDGTSYSLEFGEDLLGSVLKFNADIGPTERCNNTISLRYCIEFDAYFVPGQTNVGGKWTWGGGRGRKTKRMPEEFLKVWDCA